MTAMARGEALRLVLRNIESHPRHEFCAPPLRLSPTRPPVAIGRQHLRTQSAVGEGFPARPGGDPGEQFPARKKLAGWLIAIPPPLLLSVIKLVSSTRKILAKVLCRPR